MGTRGLDSGRPKPPGGTCDGPTVEPPVGRVLLGAWADGASEDLCALRLFGLGSLCLSTAPWFLTPTLLLRPSAKSEAIGLTGAAPPTPPAGPWTRWLLSLKDLLQPFPLLALLPPQRAPRLSSMPRKSTPRWALAGAARWGGAPEKSWHHTVTRRRHRHCLRPPPRPSWRETPRVVAPRSSVGDGASSMPPAQGSFKLDAS
jgi:hypothetical protein